MKTYKEEDVVFNKKKHRFETTDGEFVTLSDSHHFSYWEGKDGHIMGSVATDYCFACERGLPDAVKVLNKVLND